MSRLKIASFLILYLSIFPSACYTISNSANENPPEEETPPPIITTTPKPSSISIDVKIGQMLMVGFRGLSVNKKSPIIQDIKKYHLGGVILFDYDTPSHKPIRNIKSPKQLSNLIEGLQVVSSIPLFVAIDQEGGKITRLKRKFGFPKTVSAQYLGSKNDPSFTYKEAEKIAKTLANVGINFNFAPVVDVNINPNNPVIGRLRRSFSADPKIVIEHALQFIKAHHKHKIITVLKHFPGHGSSTADSHLSWADVSYTWMRKELDPYKNLIVKNQADAIMTAHVFNKRLDKEYPATLSQKIVTGLLRGELRYRGVVVSDDMQMKAVAKHYPFKEAIMRTIQAGIDVIVIGNNLTYEPNIASRTVSVIKELIQEGKITKRRIDESYRRIQELKKRWIPNRHKLTIATTPSKSVIRILNIGPKYFDGIKLQAGTYKLSINKKGYCPQRFNIDIQNQDVTKTVILKKKTSSSSCTAKKRTTCSGSEIKLTIKNSQNLDKPDQIICLKKGEYKFFVTYPGGKKSEELILKNK